MGSREVGCQVIYIVQALGLERAWGCISCQCRQRNCVPSSTHRILAAFILAGNLEALAAALSWARCVEGAAGGERAHRPEGVHCFAQESVATAALQYLRICHKDRQECSKDTESNIIAVAGTAQQYFLAASPRDCQRNGTAEELTWNLERMLK